MIRNAASALSKPQICHRSFCVILKRKTKVRGAQEQYRRKHDFRPFTVFHFSRHQFIQHVSLGTCSCQKND